MFSKPLRWAKRKPYVTVRQRCDWLHYAKLQRNVRTDRDSVPFARFHRKYSQIYDKFMRITTHHKVAITH